MFNFFYETIIEKNSSTHRPSEPHQQVHVYDSLSGLSNWAGLFLEM